MKRAARLVSLWFPFLAWCYIIYYLSSTPFLKTELGFWDVVLRKIAHVVEFGVLFLLTRRALSGTAGRLPLKKVNAVAAVFAFLYAVSDEYHQAFVPGRGPSPVDAGIDTIGIVMAYLGTLKFKAQNPNNKM